MTWRELDRRWLAGAAGVLVILGGALWSTAAASDSPQSVSAEVGDGVVPKSTQRVDARSRSEAGMRLALVGDDLSGPWDAEPASPTRTAIADLLWDSLTTTDAKGNVTPELASQVEPSKDFRTWTFRIRKDARFGTNSPVTSADVSASWRTTLARNPDSVSVREFVALVEGSDAFISKKEHIISGLSTPDASTLVVRLRRPDAGFGAFVSQAKFGVTAASLADHNADGRSIAGSESGRYLVTNTSKMVMSLQARTPGLAAPVLTVRRFETVAEAFTAFEEGEIDWSPVPVAEQEQAVGEHGASGVIDGPAVVSLMFDTRDRVLSRASVRKALMTGIQVGRLASDAFADVGQVALGLTPFDDPAATTADTCLDGCVFNQIEARRAIKTAFPSGKPTITLDVFDTKEGNAIAAGVKAQLAEVGVNVKVRSTDPKNFGSVLSGGTTQLVLMGTVSALPTHHEYLVPSFSSTGSRNVSGLANKAIDRTLAAALAAPDPSKRDALFADAEKLIRKQAVVMPIAQFDITTVFADAAKPAKVLPSGSLVFG